MYTNPDLIMAVFRTIIFVLISLLAFFISTYALMYLVDPIQDGFLDSKGPLRTDQLWYSSLMLHVFGGGVALLIGWAQFIRGIRNRWIRVHRGIGFVYWICILIAGAPSGLYLAIYANGGFSAKLGFGMLAVLWFLSTLWAVYMIKRKNHTAHKNWMIRSYALTFAAVSLRIWQPIFTGLWDIPFEDAYRAVAWFCWVPNLLIAELIIMKNIVRH